MSEPTMNDLLRHRRLPSPSVTVLLDQEDLSKVINDDVRVACGRVVDEDETDDDDEAA